MEKWKKEMLFNSWQIPIIPHHFRQMQNNKSKQHQHRYTRMAIEFMAFSVDEIDK